jgi:hypothetical protein
MSDPCIEFISSEEAKFGVIPSENSEILMHIKVVES